MQPIGLTLFMASLALLLVAWLWLVGVAFSVRWGWGLGVLLFPPTAIVFIPLHWKRTAAPVAMLLVMLVPLAWSAHVLYTVRLVPHSRVVDGELHLTLTNVAQPDYSLLANRRDVVVLQMANPDVTDETLRYLDGMNDLRELDLNYSKVTDEGLALLAQLPRLRDLRLRGTLVTDEGFRQHLANKESLQRLELSGTKVLSKTLREWKSAKPDRDYLR